MRARLADPLPAVRCGALRGLAGLGVDDLMALALAARHDASRIVARTARDVLRRR
jgi:hypothetical protein